MKRARVFLLMTALLLMVGVGCAERVSYVRENDWGFLREERRSEARKRYDQALDPTSYCYDPASQNYSSLSTCAFNLELNLYRARIHAFATSSVAVNLYDLYFRLTKVPDPRGSYGPDFPALKALEVAKRYNLGRGKVVAAANIAIEYHLDKANYGNFDARHALLIARENDLPIDAACAAVREDPLWHRMLGTMDGEEWSMDILDWCGIPVSDHSTLRLRPESAGYLRGYHRLEDLSGSRLSKYVQAEADYCRFEVKFYCGIADISQCKVDDELAWANVMISCTRPMLLEVATAPDVISRHKAVVAANKALDWQLQWWSQRASEGDERAADFASEIRGRIEALKSEI